MKKLLALLLSVALLISGLGGCYRIKTDETSDSSAQTSSQIPTDRRAYPKVDTENMRYTLQKSKLDELSAALNKCIEWYTTADEAYSKQLNESLFYMINIYSEIEVQYYIADINYQSDYGDKTAKSNFESADDIFREAQSKIFSFFNDYADDSNPFYETVKAFKSEQFPSTISRGPNAGVYDYKIERIKSDFNAIKATASDEELLNLFKEYLLTGNELAEEAYYDDYYEYVTKEVNGHHYHPDEMWQIRQYIKQYMVPLAEEYSKKSDLADEALTPTEYALSMAYDKDSYDSSINKKLLFDYIEALGEMGEKGMKTVFTKKRIVTSSKENANKVAFARIVGDTPICYFHTSDATLETVTGILGYYYSFSNGKQYCDDALSKFYNAANTLLFFSYTDKKLNNKAFKAYELSAVHNMLYQAISSAIHDEFNSIIVNEDIEALTVEKIEEILNNLMDEYGVLDWSDTFKKQIRTYWKRHGTNYFGTQLSFPLAAIGAFQLYSESKTDLDSAIDSYNSIVANGSTTASYSTVLSAWGLYTPYDEHAYLKIRELSAAEPLENLLPNDEDLNPPM